MNFPICSLFIFRDIYVSLKIDKREFSMKHKIKNISKIYNYYEKFVKKYRIFFVTLLCLSTVSNIITLSNPILTGTIIDDAINANMDGVIETILIIFFLFLINSITSFIYTYINNFLQNKIISDIKKITYSKIIGMELENFNNATIGKYISFLEGDTASISSFYVSAINSFLTCVIAIAMSGYFIFKISIRLSLVGIIAIPIMFMINIYFGKTIKKIQEMAREISDRYANNIQESLRGLKEIKGLSIESIVKNRNSQNLDDLYRTNLKKSTISSVGGLTQNLSGFLMQILIYYWGCVMIGARSLSVGHFTAFNSYINQFISSLQKISNINVSFQTTLVSIDRYEEIISNCRQEELSRKKYGELNGNIEVKELFFSYEDKKNVFNGLNINITSNELVAIVGANGSGKTTFMNLLMGFYKPKSGEILFDNLNSLEMDLVTLRENITYVQQYPFLFNDTVKNNLLAVKENATEDELVKVCKDVCLYDTIIKMPKGFDTVIGDGGTKLSGGQRQLLSIARGLLRNTKIFLLDEITSNIDGLTERNIVQTVFRLSQNHTVIMATHRATTIMQMPRIIVICDGKNVAEGTHEKLLNECMTYKELFKKIDSN